MQLTLQFDNAYAELFTFDAGGEVKEFQLMLHVSNPRLTYHQQMDALLNAFANIIEGQLHGAHAVFKRYFLSDAANQADDIIAADFNATHIDNA